MAEKRNTHYFSVVTADGAEAVKREFQEWLNTLPGRLLTVGPSFFTSHWVAITVEETSPTADALDRLTEAIHLSEGREEAEGLMQAIHQSEQRDH